MNCNNRISASAMLMAASLAFSPAAWALGLGEVRVESYLNQPLKARIDLITQDSDDLASVTAGMASADDYKLIGASIEGIPVPLRFSVEDIDGDAYIAATSTLPISEPVLRLIVEVNWSSGRLLREYTLFLDPPAVPEAAPAPRIDSRSSAAKAAPAATAAATEQPPPATVRAGAVTPAGGAEYGPVRSGETLWGIARDWSQGSGLNINQAMIAIQRENPGAFIDNNINRLKRGAILRMPNAASIDRISASAAYREVAAQNEELNRAREATAVTSAATPLLSDEATTPEEAAQPEAAAVDPSSPTEPAQEQAEAAESPDAAEGAGEDALDAADAVAEAGAQDVLELVPPSPESELDRGYGFEESEQPVEADADVQVLRENLARTEEELITQQQQNRYLEERIRELETELESAGQGPVADADLANMQDRLREERAAEARQAEDRGPWYSRLSPWLIGLLVLIAALAGWLLSRRGRGDEAGDDSLRSIQSEAEDVLRVLADDTGPRAAAPETGSEPEGEEGPESVPERARPQGKRVASEDDAELLDEESSDPEIQLDLARAYISMGDKEAARVILEEVIGNGTEEQQAEARKMLELL